MEKINLDTKIRSGMTIDDAIKEFFTQLPSYNPKIYTHKIKINFVDPRVKTVLVYASFPKDYIDKLLSFDKDYLSFKKVTKKIKRLKFEVYYINYEEYSFINRCFKLIIVKEDTGSHDILEIIAAKNDIDYANKRLKLIKSDIKL